MVGTIGYAAILPLSNLFFVIDFTFHQTEYLAHVSLNILSSGPLLLSLTSLAAAPHFQ